MRASRPRLRVKSCGVELRRERGLAAPIESGAGLGELGVDVSGGKQSRVADLDEAAGAGRAGESGA